MALGHLLQKAPIKKEIFKRYILPNPTIGQGDVTALRDKGAYFLLHLSPNGLLTLPEGV
jgi:hypothetical protein